MDNDGLLQAQAELAKREQARRHLIPFVEYCYPGYRAGKVHHFAASYIEQWASGKIRNLLIMWPPRHGKTFLATEYASAWLRGLYPDYPLMVASYSADLARRFGLNILNICKSEEWKSVFPGLEISSQSKAADEWSLAHPHRGTFVAAGRGGAQTGKGWVRGIIDDPTKDWAEASSEAFQKACWEWYQSTFRTRAQADSSICVTMTHWHEGDLAGRLLERDGNIEEGGKWTVLRLPAIAGEGDQMGRAPGEALWPENFPVWPPESDPHALNALMNIKKDVGERVWAALYQQQPLGAEGNEFKSQWFSRQWVDLPPMQRVWTRWDTALKEREANDFTAFITVGLGKDGILYGLDGKAGRWGGPEIWDMAVANYNSNRKKWGNLYDGEYIEDTGSGTSLIQWGRKKGNVRFVPVRVGKKKLIRARAVAVYCEQGKFQFPKGASWVDDWMHEILAFPDGAHDDRLDCWVGAIERAMDLESPIKQRRPKVKYKPIKNSMTGY